MVAKQVSHDLVQAGTSTTELVAANVNRTYLLIQNDGATDVYLKFGADAVVGEGIRLNANGGSYEVSDRNGNLDLREVDGISSSASDCIITEG